jgi:hypothetical protein
MLMIYYKLTQQLSHDFLTISSFRYIPEILNVFALTRCDSVSSGFSLELKRNDMFSYITRKVTPAVVETIR